MFLVCFECYLKRCFVQSMKPIISFCSRSVKSWPYHQLLLPSLHLLLRPPLILKRFAFEEREFHLLTEIISCQVTIKGRDRKFLKAMQKVVGIRRFLSPIIPEILGRRSFVIHHFFLKPIIIGSIKLPKAKDFFTWKDWQARRKPMHRIDRTSSLYKWWNVYGSHRRPLLKYKLTLEKIQDAVVVMSRTLDLGSIKSKIVRSNESYKSVIVMKSSLPS